MASSSPFSRRRPSSGASFDSTASSVASASQPPLFTIRAVPTVRRVTPRASSSVSEDSLQAVELDDPFEFHDPISEDALRQVSGRDDLSTVTYLEMSVDASDHSVSRLGELLPNLRQLKLNDSVLPSIRDLGVGVRNLRVLWLSRCGIEDLDGVGVLDNLCELYLSFNRISDVTPLALHEHLEVLDMEGNLLADVDQLDSLGTCGCLTALTLEGNPVTRRKGYRRLVHHYISHLELLDDQPLSADDRALVDEALLEEALKPLPPPGTPTRRGSGDGGTGGAGGGAGAGAYSSDSDGDLGVDSVLLAGSVRSRYEDFAAPVAPSSPVVSPVSRQHFRRATRPTTPAERPRTSLAPRRPSMEKQWQAFKRDAGLGVASVSSRSLPATPVDSARGFGGSGSPAPLSPASCRLLLGRLGSSDSELQASSSSSALTHGSGLVMAGNPVLAIRRHRGRVRARHEAKSASDDHDGAGGPGSAPSTPGGDAGADEPSVMDVLNRTAALASASRDTVIAELRSWNLESAAAELSADPVRREAMAARRPGTSVGFSRRRRGASTPPAAGRRYHRRRDRDGGTPPAVATGAAAATAAPSLPLSSLQCAPSNQRHTRADEPSSPATPSPASPPQTQAHGDVAAPVAVGPAASGAGAGAGASGLPPTHTSVPAAVVSRVGPVGVPRRPQTSAGPAASRSGHFGLKPRGMADDPVDDVAAPTPTPTPPHVVRQDPRPKLLVSSSSPPSAAAASSPPAAAPNALGEAVFAEDSDLVTLLRQRPKHTAVLKSRDSFRRYFQGMPLDRMRQLLCTAYEALVPAERDDKVARRLRLMQGLLT